MAVTQAPALVALTAGGAALARRLIPTLPGARLHGPAGLGADIEIAGGTVDHLRALFRAGTPIVGLCAAGILIRALAPLLRDKHAEPPVLAVAEDGGAVVPLLGGHRGANALARALADTLGIRAAVTTASDVALGLALDEPPAGWTLADPAAVKPVAKALLDGAAVAIEGALPWLDTSRLHRAPDGAVRLVATERRVGRLPLTLAYHPPVLAVGLGCERGAAAEEVLGLLRATLAEAGLAEGAVALIASLDLKMDEPAIHAAAAALEVPVRFFDAATLERETPRLATPSAVVFQEVGCHGVAEGAALAAVGSDGKLLVHKRKSSRATCAVAIAPGPLAAARIGRARGHLAVLGIGPGQSGWRTPEVDALLARAEAVVGYDLYLDLLGEAIAGKERHSSDLGAEEDRARRALDLAAEGRRVALVCSGDAGIYALATLVFELIERGDDPGWGRLEVAVSPGISALQAAAARAGAPLGHDFCTISLSDLLTPWPAIEARLEAAAAGDFVIAFYNPVSRRRRTQLAFARDLLLRHRPADTPVVLARNLGRTEESVQVVDLAALEVDSVDMLTLVLVGSSQTRRVPRGDGGCWVFTPRGYAAKFSGTQKTNAED